VKGTFRRSDVVNKLEIQPYVHTNRGAGDWTAPSYGSGWSPDPIYFRQTQYNSQRLGVNAKAMFQLPGNDLEVGGWYENNESNIRRVAWRLQNFSAGPAVDFNNVLRLFFDRTGQYNTTQLYVQNTNRLPEGRLKVTYGARFLDIGADFTNNGRTIQRALALPDSARPSLSIGTRGNLGRATFRSGTSPS